MHRRCASRSSPMKLRERTWSDVRPVARTIKIVPLKAPIKYCLHMTATDVVVVLQDICSFIALLEVNIVLWVAGGLPPFVFSVLLRSFPRNGSVVLVLRRYRHRTKGQGRKRNPRGATFYDRR